MCDYHMSYTNYITERIKQREYFTSFIANYEYHNFKHQTMFCLSEHWLNASTIDWILVSAYIVCFTRLFNITMVSSKCSFKNKNHFFTSLNIGSF